LSVKRGELLLIHQAHQTKSTAIPKQQLSRGAIELDSQAEMVGRGRIGQ
jgi:hypothetical protein